MHGLVFQQEYHVSEAYDSAVVCACVCVYTMTSHADVAMSDPLAFLLL